MQTMKNRANILLVKQEAPAPPSALQAEHSKGGKIFNIWCWEICEIQWPLRTP